MILYLVRHGETRYNRDGLGLGRRNEPLTPLGQEQATAVGTRFQAVALDAIYSSPLGRCRSVAAAIAGERGVAVEPRDELIEMDVGETEGLTFAAMREQYGPFLKEWAGAAGHTIAMPGGESLLDVEARLVPFLAELHALSHEAVAVVSHNFVTRLLLCRALGLGPEAFRTLNVDLASVSTLLLRDGRVFVRALNDTCHLH